MSVDKVSVIIPVLLGEQRYVDMTATCISKLDPKHQLIIVGNDSYSINVNNGIKAATGDYLIICNNDIDFIQPDWLDHLLKPLKEGYSISSIRTSDSDGYTTENRYEENAKFGSLWAITREAYEKLGPLDESFGKGYYEDQDYWRRARDMGLKIVKNHNGLVDHFGKATFSDIDKNNWHLVHAMLMYKKKWGDKVKIYETQPSVLLSIDDYDKDEPGYAVQTKGIPETSWEEIETRWKRYL